MNVTMLENEPFLHDTLETLLKYHTIGVLQWCRGLVKGKYKYKLKKALVSSSL